jgi:hypothetical protein
MRTKSPLLKPWAALVTTASDALVTMVVVFAAAMVEAM